MTITVSIDEVRAYEHACADWWKQRALEFQNVLPKARDEFSMGFARSESSQLVTDAMKKWDAAHPLPKLIPSV